MGDMIGNQRRFGDPPPITAEINQQPRSSLKIHSSKRASVLSPVLVAPKDCSQRVDSDSPLNDENWLLGSKDMSVGVHVIF